MGRRVCCAEGEAPNGCQLPNKLRSLQPKKKNPSPTQLEGLSGYKVSVYVCVGV